MPSSSRPLAIVTGASTGIGYNLAKIGFEAMMDGEADGVAGLKNKLQVAMAKVMPSQMAAGQHPKLAEPGTAEKACSRRQPNNHRRNQPAGHLS